MGVRPDLPRVPARRHRFRRFWRWLRSLLLLIIALAAAYHFARQDDERIRRDTVYVDDDRALHVFDGDTFTYRGEKIRIAGIDAPEINPPGCEREALLGLRAKARLAELLAAGPFEIVPATRDKDKYGRKLRDVRRDGRSIGGTLVDEGLARRSEDGRRPWC